MTIKVGIIGGGVAGSTIAMFLAEQGLGIELFEKGPSLVNGPPVCHLHAGGNFYREISDQQCRNLLRQSLQTMQIYPQAINRRPTVVVTPKTDPSDPNDLLPRLNMLTEYYRELVANDDTQALLGAPDDYYRVLDRAQMQALAQRPLPESIARPEDWLVPVARNINLDDIKYPVVLVQEYGLSIFRVAATAQLTLAELDNVNLHLNQAVDSVQKQKDGWQICAGDQCVQVDYLINSAGFRTGEIDDLLGENKRRLVEFKAAYITRWPECEGIWPEVIFHGPRGANNGMAQLTPYPDKVFQLHGMTPEITLFDCGLVASNEQSAQPKLASHFIEKIDQGWQAEEVELRTARAITHMARHVPSFVSAQVAGKPLYGAQQIPGDEPSLRASEVSFGERYARAEIVKSCTAIAIAEDIYQNLLDLGLTQTPAVPLLRSAKWGVNDVEDKALMLSQARNYIPELAVKP